MPLPGPRRSTPPFFQTRKMLATPHLSSHLTCAPTQLCVTPLQGQPVGPGAGAWGCGRRGSGQALPWHLHGGPQQVDLLAVDVLHVILRAAWVRQTDSQDSSLLGSAGLQH